MVSLRILDVVSNSWMSLCSSIIFSIPVWFCSVFDMFLILRFAALPESSWLHEDGITWRATYNTALYPPVFCSFWLPVSSTLGFLGGSVIKNPPSNAVAVGSVPRLERSPEEGNGNPLQYSCLGNPRDRGAWRARVHGVAKELDTTEQLNNNNNLPLYQLLVLTSNSSDIRSSK